MHEDDHLFVRCLMVVLTIAGGLLSLLLLAPPPDTAWETGLATSSQPFDARERVVTRDVRVIFRPSRGPMPMPAPIQSGETASLLQRLTAPPTPSVTRSEQRPVEPGPLVLGGPATEMSLERLSVRTSPPAEESHERVRGGDGAFHGTPRPPPPVPDLQVTMQRLQLEAENILAVRPAFPRSRAPADTLSSLSAQDTDEDPLPEFRRFMPRFQACARDVSRRAREPISGKVIIRFTVDERGHVRGARPVGGSLRDPDAHGCMVNVLMTEPVFSPRSEPITAERAVIFAG